MTDTTKNEKEIKEGHLPTDFLRIAKQNAGTYYELLGLNKSNEGESYFETAYGLSYEKGDTKSFFTGIVTSYLYTSIVKWARQLPEKSIGTLHINSRGGDAFAGIAICNLIKELGNIDVCIDGMAYSAASIIVQGGRKRYSKTGGKIGIHQASSLVFGNAEAMEKEVKQLRMVDESILEIYQSRATDMEQITEWFNEDTFVSNDNAVKVGLIDEVVEVVDKKETKKEEKKVENIKEKEVSNNEETSNAEYEFLYTV